VVLPMSQLPCVDVSCASMKCCGFFLQTCELSHIIGTRMQATIHIEARCVRAMTS
jgi:hypothetical protein